QILRRTHGSRTGHPRLRDLRRDVTGTVLRLGGSLPGDLRVRLDQLGVVLQVLAVRLGPRDGCVAVRHTEREARLTVEREEHTAVLLVDRLGVTRAGL